MAVISRSSGRCGIDASSAIAIGNVLVVKSAKISLTREPQQLVFVSAKTTNTTVAPFG